MKWENMILTLHREEKELSSYITDIRLFKNPLPYFILIPEIEGIIPPFCQPVYSSTFSLLSITSSILYSTLTNPLQSI